MKVIIACEFSGIVREAFKARGHDAWSCDLLDTEIPGQHYKGDIFDFLSLDDEFNITGYNEWDMMIAHPECTYFANSGVRWLAGNTDRQMKLLQAGIFWRKLWNLPIKKIGMENPIPHKYAVDVMGRKYDQIIQPWQFGHGETKATCLWLKGLPKLRPTNIVSGREARVHKETPGPNRWKNRSRTLPGIAAAMANQWG